MHIHILGICGTFMGGIAAIAKELGHKVTGSDLNVYPPMSTQLESLGIELTQGWDERQFSPIPDIVIIGNAMSRGNPAVEYVLNRNIPYTSGPDWLKQHFLKDRWVLAASGTHGKTTTSGMIAWILEDNGFNPGYLIGGVPGNFEVSARCGQGPFFVIEADEYDTAFFDKRSKFVHYLPKTLVINNMEFDHADIFDDISDIQRQFHHLVRTVPGAGLILAPKHDSNIEATLAQGCWSEQQFTGSDGQWQAKIIAAPQGQFDGRCFDVFKQGVHQGQVSWGLTGQHNVDNGLMAIAAAHHAGIPITSCIDSLAKFVNAKRRMELKYDHHNVRVYDDFAHHPTAIKTTLDGLRKQVGEQRIIVVLEPRSNTMKRGVHNQALSASWQDADMINVYNDDLDWSLTVDPDHKAATMFDDIEKIVRHVVDISAEGDHIVVMSNGGFGGLHQKLIDGLDAKFNH